MRLLQRSQRPPAKTIRPAERYLLAGAELARRLHHNYVGTEHILSVLISKPDGAATRVLTQLSATAEAVQTALGCWLVDTAPAAKIDADALATLGIDFDRSANDPLGDQHVLLGLLSVPESVAARVLTGLGVSLEDAQAAIDAPQ